MQVNDVVNRAVDRADYWAVYRVVGVAVDTPIRDALRREV